jgi:hypothetical protein
MLTGPYIDSSNVLHGYVRNSDGTVTSFDAPGAGTGPGQGTDTAGLSPQGVIPGFSFDSNGEAHGYVRATNGTFTMINVPGAGTASGEGTFAQGINPSGPLLDSTSMRAVWPTASFALTEPSPPSTLRARAQPAVRAPFR